MEAPHTLASLSFSRPETIAQTCLGTKRELEAERTLINLSSSVVAKFIPPYTQNNTSFGPKTVVRFFSPQLEKKKYYKSILELIYIVFMKNLYCKEFYSIKLEKPLDS